MLSPIPRRRLHAQECSGGAKNRVRQRAAIITFVLAIGSARQVCQLETTFRTQNQAFNYLHKHRTAFERVARVKLEHGEIENGIIQLTML